MEQKHTISAAVIILIIIMGMCVYAYLKRNEIRKTSTVIENTLVMHYS